MKILLSTITALFLIGCSGENKQEAKEVVAETKKEVVQNIKETQSETSEKVEDVTTEVAEKTEEVVSEVAEKAEEVVSEVADKTKELKDEAVEKTEEVASEVAEKTEEVTSEVAATVETVQEDIKEAVAAPQIDAAAIYKVCAGCHGADGSKIALGKSQVIKGWDAKKTEDALLGYKNKTYGGAMKGLMTSQVVNLSDEEIKAVSEYIATF